MASYGVGRCHHRQARCVGEKRLDALGVVQRASDSASVRTADYHWDAQLVVRSVSHAGRFADDLVDGGPDEVGKLHLGDRSQPVDGSSESDARDRRLRQRGVDDPVLAELFQQTVRRQEYTTPRADILAQDEHPLVARHLLTHGVADRLEHVPYGDDPPPKSFLSLSKGE